MATKSRNIEVLSTGIVYTEESRNRPTFADLLHFIDNKEYREHSKIYEFKLMQTVVADCMVGLIITTQDKDIPPKRHKETKLFTPIDIDVATEGLAFGNIFLYDTTRNIILYEVNRNGCFIPQLKEFIYSLWNAANINDRFSLTFPIIFRRHEYERMLRMDFYKNICVELLNPRELVQCFNEETDSLANNILKYNIAAGVRNNANSITIKQTSLTRRLNPMGLSATLIKDIIDVIRLKIVKQERGQNIKTLKVEGYFDDPESGKGVKTIDILGETFKESFRITDIEIQSDVQEIERRIGIETTYQKILPELIRIIGG